ncbi:MAG: F0F1 ATP synthase subunit A [Planctomycetes bacterium]|nr:F0F1 ATP synthase subunit A [Planctomycetota bacterium]
MIPLAIPDMPVMSSMVPLLASATDPMSHIVDKKMHQWNILGQPVMLSMVTMVTAAIVLLILLRFAAKSIATGPESMGNRRFVSRSALGGVIEVMVLYLRDEMLEPVMGVRLTRKYLPFLLSMFFFILSLNIIGLIPFVEVQEFIHSLRGEPFSIAENGTMAIFGGAATASISVTGGMAFISFVLIQVQGFRELGVKGWLEHLCGGHELVSGSPLLYPIVLLVFLVEFFGLFVKPAALAIRLFANMVAGHTLLIVFTSFGALAANAGLGWFGVGAITAVSAVGAMLITLLEVFVALLQAFVFMFLTAVFISLMAHEEHEHDEAHGEDAAHAHGAPAH